MTVELTRHKNGNYSVSVELFENSPMWLYRNSKNDKDAKFLFWHFLHCQYRENKHRWVVTPEKCDYGRKWTFKLLC